MNCSNGLVYFLQGWDCFVPVPTAGRLGFGHRIGEAEKITRVDWARAEDMLRGDLALIADEFGPAIRIAITQCKFDAFCAFVYATEDVETAATIIRLLNSAQFDRAALQFTLWCSSDNSAGLRRRFAEQAMFTRGDYGIRP